SDSQSFVRQLALDRVSATWSGTWDGAAYTATGTINATTTGPSASPLTGNYNVGGGGEGGALLAGNVDMTMGEGAIACAVSAPRDGTTTVQATLKTLNPAPWAAFAGQTSYPGDMTLSLDGPVTLSMPPNEPITITP